MAEHAEENNVQVRSRGIRRNGSEMPPRPWREEEILEGEVNGQWIEVQIKAVIASPEEFPGVPFGSYSVLVLNPVAKASVYATLPGNKLRVSRTSRA
ncbi:hypothetical protein FRC12_016723 [Ceratobasidium sp. 428]|nr:hypothetical protein FRC12_016723 [Ceratobasidium sp. 428]